MINKKALFFMALLYGIVLGAQVQGVAYYKADFLYKMSEDSVLINRSKSNPQFLSQLIEIEENVSFLLEDTKFILKFNNGESIFEIEPRVEHEKNRFSPLVTRNTDSGGIFYHNIDSSEFIRQKKAFGKTYLIALDTLVWKLHTENKMIDKYFCYKATANRKIVLNNGKTKTFPITVWYAPEIPVNSGPRGYAGLPGLIIESNMNGAVRFTLQELRLNPKKEISITKPTKGVHTTEKGFRELDKKASNTFRN